MSRTPSQLYEDFLPSFHWNREEGSDDTLVLSLPGFNKDQLKVQMDTLGNLRVSGERPLHSSERRSRFQKDFRIPENTDTAEVRAKFENGNLYINFPKLFSRPQPQEKPVKAQATDTIKKPSTDQPKPREEQDIASQRNKPPSFSKTNSAIKEPSEVKRREGGEPTDAMKNAQKAHVKEKDQTQELQNKQATSEFDDEYSEMSRTPSQLYEDFLPSFHWNREEGSDDTLVLSLPGFNNDQLKVQMDTHGNLRVSGERPLGSSERRSRFQKNFRIPESTDTAEIRAEFENGNLYINFPKLFSRPQPQEKPVKAQATDTIKKPSTDQPKPREEQDIASQRNKPPSFSKTNSAIKEPSDVKRREAGEPTDAMKNAQKAHVREKDQTQELQNKQATSEFDDEYSEMRNSMKRKKNGVEEMYDGGIGMRFKKQKQIMVNVGVALVILMGLTFYVTYNLKKSI